MEGLVREHLSLVVVMLSHSGCHPPSWLVCDDLLDPYLTMNLPGELAQVLKSAISEELQYLAVPLIVLRAVDPVLGRIDMLGKHPVGQA